jgi:hypothetical protein
MLYSSYGSGYELSRAVVYAGCGGMNVALTSVNFLSTLARRIHRRPERFGVEKRMEILNRRADANRRTKAEIRDRAVFMGKYRRQKCNWKWMAG